MIHSWDLHVTSSCHRIKVYSVNKSKPQTAERLRLLESKSHDIHELTKPTEFSLEGEEEYLQAYRANPREPVD